MEQKKLKDKIYSKIDELPTLPVVIPKLLGLIENEESDVSDITEVISRDLALTSKILKVANSAYYGFPQQILKLEHAVALLGYNMVKSLALSIGVIKTFPHGKKSSSFSVEGLWLHSLSVATMMQELGKRFAKENSEEPLFVIGLLHDVGKVVLYQFFGDLFQQALEKTNKPEELTLHAAEQEVIGIDHCQVAGMLLTRWKFPDIIVNPIAFHYHSEISEGTDPVDIAMLRIANIIDQETGLEDKGNATVSNVYQSDLAVLEMNDEDFDDMKTYSYSIKDESQSLLNAIT